MAILVDFGQGELGASSQLQGVQVAFVVGGGIFLEVALQQGTDLGTVDVRVRLG